MFKSGDLVVPLLSTQNRERWLLGLPFAVYVVDQVDSRGSLIVSLSGDKLWCFAHELRLATQDEIRESFVALARANAAKGQNADEMAEITELAAKAKAQLETIKSCLEEMLRRKVMRAKREERRDV